MRSIERDQQHSSPPTTTSLVLRHPLLRCSAFAHLGSCPTQHARGRTAMRAFDLLATVYFSVHATLAIVASCYTRSSSRLTLHRISRG